ncbi:peptidoglycan binding protein [Roseivivax marinus]|uniref:Peptidoglycan binding protein n=1 Tax=Roseivivax marinus TaxID=1379903 RepID=W4HQ68_9RHOB|nr:L,D-transpeptidase family protein [Roseivivax marinus]ETW14155.1 peptidoglycan binding protein [Roseivivax marinus]
MTRASTLRNRTGALLAGAALALTLGFAAPATAQVTAFKRAVAETVGEDEAVAAFYRNRGFEPVWTGPEDIQRLRREALLEAVTMASAHGLPAGRYDANALMAEMRAARTAEERGALDVHLSLTFARFARDLSAGALDPRRVISGLKREVYIPDTADLLDKLESDDPRAVFRGLAPSSPEYGRLMREKMRLERVVARGGWGRPVSPGRIDPGESGSRVVPLRDRLIAMNYLRPTASAVYDSALEQAVKTFQADHGLAVDGIAGDSTLRELNHSPETRLQQVLVAMERERWLNRPGGLGKRHIKVNLTEFMARVYDDEKVTFETRAVIGSNESDRQTPEFSDEMDHMVINPSWYVPRSIIKNEYLPQLRRNPYAVSHLQILNSRGQVVSRNQSFAGSFPYSMRQPPGPKNALGQVKFMFPNKYNIYLHDTPAQHLFSRTVRAYSHGCVRLDDPYEFAYTLLAKQEDDPEGFFHSRLRTGAEARVNLVEPVPVHLIYRTAFTQAKGHVQYRPDIYNRDQTIWRALSAAGVVLGRGES